MKLSNAEKKRYQARYGSWAVVTGATSGIGREVAELLAGAGLNLLIVARGADALQARADEWVARYGVAVQPVAADLSDEAGVAAVLAAAASHEVGLLVAAAGYGTAGSFLTSGLATELNMLHTNCAAVLSLTHHFSQVFATRGRGGIILLGSIVGFQGTPYAAHYAATKAYVQVLAEGLHVELRSAGVDVLAAAPGPVHSGFAARAGQQMGLALRPADVALPMLRALGRRQTVLPGWLSKLLVWSLRTAPRWGKVHIMGMVMRGMVAK